VTIPAGPQTHRLLRIWQPALCGVVAAEYVIGCEISLQWSAYWLVGELFAFVFGVLAGVLAWAAVFLSNRGLTSRIPRATPRKLLTSSAGAAVFVLVVWAFVSMQTGLPVALSLSAFVLAFLLAFGVFSLVPPGDIVAASGNIRWAAQGVVLLSVAAVATSLLGYRAGLVSFICGMLWLILSVLAIALARENLARSNSKIARWLLYVSIASFVVPLILPVPVNLIFH